MSPRQGIARPDAAVVLQRAWHPSCPGRRNVSGTAPRRSATAVFLLPLSTEFEVTENFGDFWVPFYRVRYLLRCLVRVFHRDGCCEIYDGDARRHLVRDVDALNRVRATRDFAVGRRRRWKYR